MYLQKVRQQRDIAGRFLRPIRTVGMVGELDSEQLQGFVAIQIQIFVGDTDVLRGHVAPQQAHVEITDCISLPNEIGGSVQVIEGSSIDDAELHVGIGQQNVVELKRRCAATRKRFVARLTEVCKVAGMHFTRYASCVKKLFDAHDCIVV